MRGAATTISVIMIIIIMATFFGIFLYMYNNQVQSNIRLNVESLDIFNLKSTFNTFDKSLGTTWFISTVQTVFATADESIGCGYENGRVENNYWYQGSNDRARDFSTDSQGNPRIPNGKYNAFGMNPQICDPKDSDIMEYLEKKFSDGGYGNIQTQVDAGSVSLAISDASHRFALNDESVDSVFGQKIVAERGKGVISAVTENFNTVKTSLKRMAASGREISEDLLFLGDAFYGSTDPLLHYQPNPFNTDSESYKERLKSLLESFARTTHEQNNPDINLDVTADVNLFVANSTTVNILQPGLGLLVSYDMTMRYSDGFDAPPPTFVNWPADSRSLNSCYGFRNHPINDRQSFHTGIDVAPTNPGVSEPVLAAKDGIVIEVNGDCPGNNCEKPGHSRYGNFVLIDHGGFFTFYAHLDSVSVKPFESVSTAQQIGTMGTTGQSTGVHLHFEIRRDKTTLSHDDPCSYMDCTESTLEQCTALTTQGIYYYHDEEANIFTRRPITLETKARDYLPALRCTDWASPQTPVVFFNWNAPQDMACCGGYIFSCNADVPEMPAAQALLTGGTVDDTGNAPDAHEVCGGVLSGGTLTCTSSGFDVR